MLVWHLKLPMGQGRSQIQDQGQDHRLQEDNRWKGEDFQVHVIR